jgi:hypothetical protein
MFPYGKIPLVLCTYSTIVPARGYFLRSTLGPAFFHFRLTDQHTGDQSAPAALDLTHRSFCPSWGTPRSERNLSNDSREVRVFLSRGSPPKFGVKVTSNPSGRVSDAFTTSVPCCFRSSMSSTPKMRRTEESVTSPLWFSNRFNVERPTLANAAKCCCVRPRSLRRSRTWRTITPN